LPRDSSRHHRQAFGYRLRYPGSAAVGKTKERVFGQLRGKLALEVGSLEHHQTRNSGEKSHPAL
ncbi:hypothetical protein KXW01_007643, partial [Aspergillus fumigatus]